MTRLHMQRLFIPGFLAAVLSFSAAAQYATLDWRQHNVGKIRQTITNLGTMNAAQMRNMPSINCEFPAGSNEEHLYQGGLWIGGITPTGDTLVSETQSHFGPNEFYPTAERWDTIWTARKNDTLQIPYWPNYIGVSDQDFVCRYSDYNILNIDNHTPLYLDVIQTSYAWSSKPVDEFLLYTYYIIPKKIPIKNMYIGFWMHGSVGNVACGDNFIDENIRYYSDMKMAVDQDAPGACDGISISPIGFRVMSPNAATMPNLRWTMKYYEHEDMPQRDNAEYREMASGTVMLDRLDQPARAHIILAFGPFNANVGDTVKVIMSEVLGYGLKGVLDNAAYMDKLMSKGFHIPSAPPVPKLTVMTKNHEVYLDWEPKAGDVNPELYTDKYRGDTIKLPFEGYRVYRSTQGKDGPWTMLAEFDIANDDIGYNTGLHYTYKDAGLVNNVVYAYAITSYSKPDKTLNFPSQETSTTSNAVAAVPGTAPPPTVGQVAVVPNPYRGDIAYNSYNPPWEGDMDKTTGIILNKRPWMEQDRRIQFINLPSRCEIKIYTLAGDLVTTLQHDNPTRGYEDWNLTSSVGQAVSSGLYLFTAEDKLSGRVQVGKFVIIK